LLPRVEGVSWKDKGTGEIQFQEWVLNHVINFTYPGLPVNLSDLENLHKAGKASSDQVEALARMQPEELSDLRQRLNFLTEAILVSCGQESNLLLRNVRDEKAVKRLEDHQSLAVDQNSNKPETFPSSMCPSFSLVASLLVRRN